MKIIFNKHSLSSMTLVFRPPARWHCKQAWFEWVGCRSNHSPPEFDRQMHASELPLCLGKASQVRSSVRPASRRIWSARCHDVILIVRLHACGKTPLHPWHSSVFISIWICSSNGLVYAGFVSHLLHSAHFPESQAHKLDVLVNELRNHDAGPGASRTCNAAPTPQYKVCHVSLHFSDSELLSACQPLHVSILCFVYGTQ